MEGNVARLIGEKGFGFIKTENGVDYFFHRQDFAGLFDELIYMVDSGQHIKVTFDVVPSPKGPRAANVRLLE